ncbi:MAG TPA: L-threonine 3-dehydrogenase, partial [Candidatus Saccharicenans sp.]|nr:L-threonine 3-dehydrogenase [Candidatus Saccharicenans sp.]
KHLPDFEINYQPDFRQAIADSWPESIDDSSAREEWGWQPDYDLTRMTSDMFRVLQEKKARGNLFYPG